MKALVTLLTALAGIEGVKPFLEKFNADVAAELGGVKFDDIAGQLSGAKASDATIQTLTAQVNELGGKVQGLDTIRGTLKAREEALRTVHLERAWTTEAAKHGLKPGFMTAAMKLAKLDGVKFDPETSAVTGLTKDVFEGVKTQYPDMFGGVVDPVKSPKNENSPSGNQTTTPIAAGGFIGTLAQAFATPKAP